MPNLSDLWSASNQSLIPQSAVTSAQNAITTPRLDESPTWAKIKGFGAGALQGLRDQITPLGIAALVAGTGAGAGMRALTGGAEGLEAGVGAARAAAPTMELLGEAPAVQQTMPTGSAVDSLTNIMRNNLMKVPSAKGVDASQAIQGLRGAAGQGMLGPESGGLQDMMNPRNQAMMEKMYQESRPVAQDLIRKGAFSGNRTVGGQ
jgi:hypothetical protein